MVDREGFVAGKRLILELDHLLVSMMRDIGRELLREDAKSKSKDQAQLIGEVLVSEETMLCNSVRLLLRGGALAGPPAISYDPRRYRGLAPGSIPIRLYLLWS